MATTKKTKAAKAAHRASVKKKVPPTSGPTPDAIALLEADHREVETYFDAFEDLTSAPDKKALANKICLALKVHAQIEEEFFYPVARDKTGDDDLVDEAIVEHEGAKILVAQISSMAPDQPLYDAKVKVLGEQIRHHVKEEEEELFPEVRETSLDLKALGKTLAARRAELMALYAPAFMAPAEPVPVV